jgi:hypothetical protein
MNVAEELAVHVTALLHAMAGTSLTVAAARAEQLDVDFR